MSLFGFFRGFFGGSGDPFSRGMTLDDEDEEDDDDEDDVGGVFGRRRGDSFTFSFGPDGGKFDDGFSGLFQEMDELFRGFGSWEVPGKQFELPGIDPRPYTEGSEQGGRRSLRDWMLKEPEQDHPGRRRDTDPVGDSDPHPRERPNQDRPRAGPLTPYFSPWGPSNSFEELWKNLRQRDTVKEDTDLDSKVNSEGLDKILKPTEPERKSFFKSVSVSKVVLPDGSTEERRVRRDGEGNEEITVTRTHGDQSYTTVTRRDAEGKEEQTERMVNLDDGDLQKFVGKWDRRQGDSVLNRRILWRDRAAAAAELEPAGQELQDPGTMVLVNEILGQIVQVDRPMTWGSLATLRPYANFLVDEDVERLKRAIDTKGVDEATIVKILGNRTLEQREQIAKNFKKQNNADLETVLAKKLSGYLENVMITLLKSPTLLDAQTLKDAMKGLGTDEDTLIEILATRSSKEIQAIKSIYKQEFQKDLEKEIVLETSGRFQKLLVALLTNQREVNSNIINYELIEEDAKSLYAVASQKKNPDFNAWIPILTERSQNHLNRVFKLYKVYSATDISETIKKEMKGDEEKGFLSLVQSIQNTPEYLADRLHSSMKSMGTKDKTVTRLLVSRCEVDLLSIRAEFRKKYGKSLYSTIQADTKGDYQTALLGLCRAEDL